MLSVAKPTYEIIDAALPLRHAYSSDAKPLQRGLVPAIGAAVVGAIVAAIATAGYMSAMREESGDVYANRIAVLEKRMEDLWSYNREVRDLDMEFVGSMHADIGWLLFKDECTNLALWDLAKTQALESVFVEFLAEAEADPISEDFAMEAKEVRQRLHRLMDTIDGLRANRHEHMNRKDKQKFNPPPKHVVE